MQLHQIIRKYNNEMHVRGTMDSNLLFLEVHEPEFYNKILGKYKTIVGGCRVAKKHTGFISIRDVLDNSGRYEIIEPHYQTNGDIVTFDDGHDIYISLGKHWFGVDLNDTFSVVAKHAERPNTIYRRL